MFFIQRDHGLVTFENPLIRFSSAPFVEILGLDNFFFFNIFLFWCFAEPSQYHQQIRFPFSSKGSHNKKDNNKYIIINSMYLLKYICQLDQNTNRIFHWAFQLLYFFEYNFPRFQHILVLLSWMLFSTESVSFKMSIFLA